MHFKIQSSLLFACIFLVTTLHAQSKKEKKWDEGIKALSESEFVILYKGLRDKIQENTERFQNDMIARKLGDEEIDAVAKSYDATVDRFDKILEKLKTNFADQATRKEMAKASDNFTQKYMPDLKDAYKYYLDNCQRKMDILVPTEEGAAIGIGEVQLILAAGNLVYKIVEEHQAKMAKMSSLYFEQHFISDLRLKRWEEY